MYCLKAHNLRKKLIFKKLLYTSKTVYQRSQKQSGKGWRRLRVYLMVAPEAVTGHGALTELPATAIVHFPSSWPTLWGRNRGQGCPAHDGTAGWQWTRVPQNPGPVLLLSTGRRKRDKGPLFRHRVGGAGAPSRDTTHPHRLVWACEIFHLSETLWVTGTQLPQGCHQGASATLTWTQLRPPTEVWLVVFTSLAQRV